MRTLTSYTTSAAIAHTDAMQKILIDKCIRRDDIAQKELYHTYAPAMYQICRRMMGHHAAAQDCLQEAFAVIFSKLNTFKYKSTLGAWIKRIVINQCLQELRSEKRIDEMKTNYAQLNESTEHLITLDIEKLKQAVDTLPNGYRVIFTLYAFEGYDHQEIGQILNISPSTSKSQYHRAKKKIIEWMS